MRQKQIDEIKQSKNLPVLVFTHPKDPYDGLLSDWNFTVDNSQVFAV